MWWRRRWWNNAVYGLEERKCQERKGSRKGEEGERPGRMEREREYLSSLALSGEAPNLKENMPVNSELGSNLNFEARATPSGKVPATAADRRTRPGRFKLQKFKTVSNLNLKPRFNFKPRFFDSGSDSLSLRLRLAGSESEPGDGRRAPSPDSLGLGVPGPLRALRVQTGRQTDRDT